MTGVCYITSAGRGEILVKAPYEARHFLRLMGGRWRPAPVKAWALNARLLDDITVTMRRYFGCTVYINNRPMTTPTPATSSWAVALFEAIPPHLRDDAFRALIGVLHPDRGGDHRCAQELIAAHEKARERGVA